MTVRVLPTPAPHVRTVGPQVQVSVAAVAPSSRRQLIVRASFTRLPQPPHIFRMAEVDQPPSKRAKVDGSVEDEQPLPSANAVNNVRLPGREVNAQRARLWQQLGSNALLFDVTLKASDRDVPCNRSVASLGPFAFSAHLDPFRYNR